MQSVSAERLQQERRRVELPASPAGANVKELGARDAEEEDRYVAREVGDVLDEIREDGLTPLQVVDHNNLWLLRGPCLEQPTEGQLRLGR